MVFPIFLFTVHQRCPKIKLKSCSNFSSKTARTHYEELGVAENATAVEIKNAFIKKSKEVHPDINPQDPELHDAFVKISAAYNVLGNKESKKQYDLKLNTPSNSHSTSNYSYSTGNPFGARGHASHYTHQNSWHEASRHPQVQRRIRKNPYNKYVVIGALLFMFCGATVHYVVLNYRHKRYKAHVEEASRKANLAYTESKERARSNGIHKQLELLMALHSHPGRNLTTSTNDDNDNS
ncbi:dnaJ homolog subfamily C member 4 isoform X2 [Exaiptasia diaphana]|uniref:J domain-containing protein n=1 Tax=Exaiptasia diaphana TaxID=2652724 RepID=A0A913X533_EXADI|nr:dnaJ homolog subfamily C member 4 isoform X2 [Exaiptasia diaphana]